MTATDPTAGRLVRALLAVGRRRRGVRTVFGVLAAYTAVQLLPYAMWEGPAPVWAIAGLVASALCWVGLPAAARLCELRYTVSEADLVPGSQAAGLLGAALGARRRFEEAAAHLGGSHHWVDPARRDLDEALWAVAGRARGVAELEASLAEVHRGAGGAFRSAEEQRLTTRLTTQRRLATDVVAEMDALAHSAERAAVVVDAASAPGSESWSEGERTTVEALRRYRLHLQALQSAWTELSDPPRRSGGGRTSA